MDNSILVNFADNFITFIIIAAVVFLVDFGVNAIFRKIANNNSTGAELRANGTIGIDMIVTPMKYSQELVAYIKQTCELVATLEYSTFRDSHDLSKVTRETLKNLASDTAKAVNAYIDINEFIDINDTLVNKQYIDYIIINYTFTLIKNMYDSDME